jgi:4-amino-4-deoxy-L-arabinose transferase-like glycosyltransferase
MTRIAFIVSLLVFLVNLAAVDNYHRDEQAWSAVSAWAFRAVLERDFGSPGWSERYWTFGSSNPNVGKYLIGLSLWLNGHRDAVSEVKLARWEKGRTVGWHQRRGLVPDAGTLYATRLPSAVAAAGAAALACALASLATNPNSALAGGLAAALFVAHPLAGMMGRRAMLDMPAASLGTLAVALALLAGLALGRSRGRALALAAGSALVAGLAVSTKMNALLAWAAALAVWGLAAAFHVRDRRALAAWLGGLLLLAVVPPAVFVATNPHLWRDTAAGVREMLELSDVVAGYRRNNPAAALTSPGQKVEAFLGFAFPHAVLGLVALLGIGFTLRDLWRGRGQFVAASRLAWAAMTCAGVALWSPLAWARYYLPAVPAVAVLGATGAVGLLETMLKKNHRREKCI